MSNIEERVIKMVAEQLGVKEEDVKITSSFVEDLGADSLDTVELIMALEEEFDAEIPDEEAEKLLPFRMQLAILLQTADFRPFQKTAPIGAVFLWAIVLFNGVSSVYSV